MSDPNIPDFDWENAIADGSENQRPWYLQWLVPLLIVLAGVLFTCRRRLPSCRKRRERGGYEEIK